MDRQEKAFDFAQELAKQLITLATGVLTATITFRDSLTKGITASPVGWLSLLQWGWLAQMISIAFGVWALMALTGELTPASGNSPPPAPRLSGFNVRFPFSAQILTFLVGTALISIYVINGL
jgi:hypothetical protein